MARPFRHLSLAILASTLDTRVTLVLAAVDEYTEVLCYLLDP